uniref:Uncharacterized protein n=1 Tax=Romanomermis culicivorax TaxID=13658 RepID=A0A915IXG9_ROMCU
MRKYRKLELFLDFNKRTCFYGYCGSNRYGSLINPYSYTTNWNSQYPTNNCGYIYSCLPSQSARLVIGSNVDGNSLRRSGSVCATDAECYSGTCFSGICSNDSPVPGKVGTSGQCTVDARCYSNVCNNGQCT